MLVYSQVKQITNEIDNKLTWKNKKVTIDKLLQK